MKKRSKDSKLNVALSALLVVFVSLLTFSIGVITGKGWSDRDVEVRNMKNDKHLNAAMEDVEPLGDEMTDKEVELLTQRAMEEAQAQQPEAPQPETSAQPEATKVDDDREPASSSDKVAQIKDDGQEVKGGVDENEEMDNKPEVSKTPAGREASQAKTTDKKNREVSSLMPPPTTPKPTSIEYTVQVAAYKTIEEAEVHSQKLIDKGFPAFPVRAIINEQDWYRVSIGSFKNRKQAMKYQEALKKQAVVKNSLVQEIVRLKK